MIEVTAVRVLKNYQLLLNFNNQECRIFDMAPYLDDPVFRPLQHEAFFGLAKVNYGTVVWPQDIDIAPETLWEKGKPVSP